MHGHDQQELDRTPVDDPALFALELDKFDRTRLTHRRLQVVQRVVELDGNNAARVFLLVIRCEVARHDFRQDIPLFPYRDKHVNAPFLNPF